MAKALAFGAAVLLLHLTGCSPFGSNAFICQNSLECRRGAEEGRCEPDGLCSFPDSTCDSDWRYGEHSGSMSNDCVGGSPPPDARDPDAPQPEAGEVCFGSPGSFAQPCFAMTPSGSMMLLAGNIDTDNSTMCATVSNTTACVIAGGTIQVPLGAIVTASGSKPLVLVATDTIEVLGTIDVASHRNPPPADADAPFTTLRIGAAADASCGTATAGDASGGGAGGTLGGLGGVGGAGGAGAAGGTAAPVVSIGALRGGCRGQAGSTGTPGDGGHGGGAVWLIANTITIGAVGVINASGEGGHPGVTGAAGGGGGGSGGMIGLDAQTITNGGAVFANGGSGGEGSGNTTRGNGGNEANSAAAALPPASGSNGGAGGGGGAGGSAGGTPAGGPGTAAATFGGGGGGGSTGIIKVYRGTLDRNFSPNPS